MSERDLWAAVAEAAITDHAKLIAAARKGRTSILIDASNDRKIVGAVEREIANARRYFDSRDWREVSSLAGLNLGTEEIMAVIQNGWRPYRVSHRVANVRTGQTIEQGAV